MVSADLILILHFAFVLGVVLPVPLIVIGGLCQWKFVRNSWFRSIHLAMMALVVFESLIGLICPLTTLEQKLRERAGQPTYSESFIKHWVGSLLYYNLSPRTFLVIYALFGSLILILYFVYPPEWLTTKRRHN